MIDDLLLPDMSSANFMRAHVILGAVGILCGVFTLRRMVNGRRLGSWNALFLVSTTATCITGLQLQQAGFGMPRVVGMIVLAVLAVALVALVFGLAGFWRAVYAVSVVLALYLNIAVGAVQGFHRLPRLLGVDLPESDMPFLAMQAIVLIVFVVLAFAAVRRFRPA